MSDVLDIIKDMDYNDILDIVKEYHQYNPEEHPSYLNLDDEESVESYYRELADGIRDSALRDNDHSFIESDVDGDGNVDLEAEDVDGDGDIDVATIKPGKGSDKAEQAAEDMLAGGAQTPEEYLMTNQDATPEEYREFIESFDPGTKEEREADALEDVSELDSTGTVVSSSDKKENKEKVQDKKKPSGELLYNKEKDTGLVGTMKKLSPARNKELSDERQKDKAQCISDERQKDIIAALTDRRW